MRLVRRFLGLVLLTSLSACVATPPDWAAPPPKALTSPEGTARISPPIRPDLCGASALTYLVGRPRTEIPVPVDPAGRRVSCTTCAVMEEPSETRQSILFDAETGLVTSVGCG